MNPPFSFQDTSMVFHAPVQRRLPGPAIRPTPSDTRARGAEPPLPARRAPAPSAFYPPAERSYSPLPALPTLLHARSHLRSLPDHGLSPISSPAPAPGGRETPIYRPFSLATSSTATRNSQGFLLEGSRGPSREHARTYRQERQESTYNEERVAPFDSPMRFLPRRHSREDFSRGRFISDSSADSPSYESSPLPHRQTETHNTHPARVRPVESSSAPTAEPAKKKRKARICTTEGCTKYVVDHGLCIRHGGGKRCYIDGCECRAQNRGLCWKHGGFTICKVDGCTKRAKSRGICWSHGGGTRCKRDDCSKIAVSNGLCWAHGGGKRCAFGKCRKPASERTDNFCNEHYAQEYSGLQEAEL